MVMDDGCTCTKTAKKVSRGGCSSIGIVFLAFGDFEPEYLVGIQQHIGIQGYLDLAHGVDGGLAQLLY
jgi:hypothetical protein